MKIWVIGRSYPGKSNRMWGSFELEQAKLLAKKGNEVCYIACVFHPFRKIRKWGFCSWTDEQVHVYSYSLPYFPDRLHVYLDGIQLKIWKRLLSSIEEKEGLPDIIHVHYPTLLTQPSAILDFKKYGTKIVATEHWTAVQSGKINAHEKRQLKKYVAEADSFICVGAPLRNKIRELTHTKQQLLIVPNVVPDFFECKMKNWNDFRFIAVGRLVPVKQFDHIIQAFWEVYSGCKDVTLTIVGGGSEYIHLKSLIDRLGASEQITLTGTLPRNKTSELISSSDVLVCYSRLETFGVPVIEALYCGIPVIASNAIGFLDDFDESLGILVDYSDDVNLKDSLLRIKDDYDKYSKEKIHSFAENNYSESAVYMKLIEIYNK